MEKCKYCRHVGVWKAGIVRKKQQYKCPECRCAMCVKDSRIKFTDKGREATITLYLEENGFRRIARIMSKIFNKNYRYQTIMNWIKNAGLKVLSEKTKQEKVDVLEMSKSIDCY